MVEYVTISEVGSVASMRFCNVESIHTTTCGVVVRLVEAFNSMKKNHDKS